MPTEKGRELMRALLEEGEAAARAGNWGAAREAAEGALAIDPESVTASALLERATSMLSSGAPAATPPPLTGEVLPPPQAARAANGMAAFPRKESHVGRNVALTIGGIFAFLLVLGMIGAALDDDDGSPASTVADQTTAPQTTSNGAACATSAHIAYLQSIGAEAIELSGLFTAMSDALALGDFAEVRSLSFEMEALYETLASHQVPSGFDPIHREISAAASDGTEAMALLRDGLQTANAVTLDQATARLTDSNAAVDRASRLFSELGPGECP